VLAAQRAGIHRVVLPSENEPELEELPDETREAVEFVLADSLDRVLAAAFDGAGKRRTRRPAAAERQAATPAGTS
jgi:ATP-dependent Lon protease